ncbi:TonB-dependent receptor [Flavobacterium soli]|uniref:TonB-dependent receptor n=1 Tax=Flavobacterium soli TaxID=344881 RepID=UPI0004193EA1|nr:TonB-dependent receptor [Flavobacterium soli]
MKQNKIEFTLDLKKLLIIIVLVIGYSSFAQKGTIRGQVIDNFTDQPLEGVTVIFLTDSTIGTTTNAEGKFRLENLPIGRGSFGFSFLGYETATIANIDVTSGKEVSIDIRLTESYSNLNEVVVRSGPRKDQAINKLAAVSARQVSVEEITKYAGGRSDVARLASNFAGVSAPNDSRNDIVVRGNSPTGLLWRIDGIPVPSPNHFSTLGTTGSPVSALNPNVMGNSDFLTSAFPAEYGNALGGVFDINFRKGNTDKYEYTVGVGAMTGFEGVAEGPMGKDGSFMVAARYGLAGIVGGMGTGAIPNYSDLSFNLDFGKTKLGSFTLFGIAGNSTIDFNGEEDYDDGDLFSAPDENFEYASQFGMVGLRNTISLNDYSSIKTTIGGSFSGQDGQVDRIYDYGTPQANLLRFADIDNTETRLTLSSVYNAKFNNKFTFRSGVLLEQFNLSASVANRLDLPDNDGDGYPDYQQRISNDGGYTVFQPYAQGQYRLTESFTLNAGLHTQYFSLNEAFVAEPRASLTWQLAKAHSITFGYGLHHQNVPAPILFLNENVNGTDVQANKDLDLVRSNHYVLGYDLRPGTGWRAKIEAYYQDITNAAVDANSTGYSSLTEGSDFIFSFDELNLVSEGVGHNYGLELTVEKFLSNGWYSLATASLFEAKYEGSDGIERNSPFNNGYVFNVLGGKEFKVGKNGKNVLSIDSRFSTSGGRYYTPVDLAASQAVGYQILQDDLAFSEQYDPYLRLDLKIGMKINSSKRKVSHQFYVDFQNVTNNENVFIRQYNRLTNSVDQVDQIGFFPDFGYKIQF